ncbi:zygotic DNA replication licensing factor mcm3-like [Oppia nitens]|uniref:zygotic DNA replication licensing factor mcm3-like n=1 Tax=Oppia nitens TaxID=1686743 RepID=UPI0023DC342E|nr:zygotic DNA replication licensing factor mcm3-like [Oppia nitens]
MADIELDQRLRQIQSQYLDFLDDDSDQGVYSDAVKAMIKANEYRIVVDINDLRRKLPERVEQLLNNSVEDIIAIQRALKEFVTNTNPEYSKQYSDFFVGFEGSFGSKHVTPRTLSSRHLAAVVAVEGIVTRCSLVRPKVVKSVHYCPQTKKTVERKYTDLTSFEAFPSSSAYPTKDEDGNLLETEFGLSVYKDHQTFTIQEMPEKAPAGQLPRSIDIIADNDLVDKCKPGDRVQVVGSYRCLPAKQGYYTNGTFRTVMLSTNVNLLSKEVSTEITAEDFEKCKRFSRQKKGDVFEILSRSLAPSIYGHDYIKKALLCMLLGGLEKVLPNGTRLRGDINILLIGDPSVSKSQLLRYVLNCAPRAVATTGRGSSGVGLTAAVTTDPETRDRRLEAGAMVLADRGVVCIDEFDKMSDIDRTAIHEVMEQGRVTITKAGIHAKLNARCSVLAAANPVYGRYDQYKTPMENIGLQDSLLSRFDLLFIMLDKNDFDTDTAIADHVVNIHRYRAPTEADGEPLPIMSNAEFLSTKDSEKLDKEDTETPIYERHDALLHGNRPKSEKIVSIQFMKKYIHIAKAIKPKLSKEACDLIAEEYTKLRSHETDTSEMARTQPVTARTLETMIRLATAHARARLSNNIEMRDATIAVELVQFAIFKEVLSRPKKRKREDDEAMADEEESDEEDMDVDTEPRSQPKRRMKKERTTDDPYEFDEEEVDDDEAEETKLQSKIKKSQTITTVSTEDLPKLSDQRLKQFRSFLSKEFRKVNAQSLPLQQIYDSALNEKELNFTKLEVQSALNSMQEDFNQIFISNDIVILV